MTFVILWYNQTNLLHESKMRATKDNIIEYLKDIKPELSKKGVDKLALFGSFAKDEQNIYSDIDIAISKESDFLSKFSAYAYFDLISLIKEKVSMKFHKKTDIFDLDSKGDFKKNIEKELIYV